MSKLVRGNFHPELIRAALRQGANNIVQMFGGGTAVAGNALVFDADGNAIDSGVTPGGSGTVTHTAGALTAGQPVFGNGAADVKAGTKRGNTTVAQMADSTTAPTSGHLTSFDASGNTQDAGIASSAVLQTSRTISTTAPLTGGGDLSANRTLAVSDATASSKGVVQPDGTTITISGGVITAVGSGSPGGTSGQVQYNSAGAFGGASGATVSGGNLLVTTQTQGDNSTKTASTAYTDLAVSNAIAGVNPAVAVQAATTAASDTSGFTYSNGVGGIGATFTGGVNTAVAIDGYTFTALGQRLLVKNDTQAPSGAFNGVYYVTQLQTSLLPPILTRALDYDAPSDINNTGAIPVVNGTTNGTTSWLLTSKIATVGTDPLTYTKFTVNPSTVPQKYTTSWSAQTSVTVTHNLGTTAVIVQVATAGGVLVQPESITITSGNVVTLTFGAAFTGSVVVIG
jgi:hypothetical protein